MTLILMMVVAALALGSVGLAVNLRLKKYQEDLRQIFDNGREAGRKEAIEEMKQIKEDRGSDYRTAASIYARECAECGRTCIHCARETSSKPRVRVNVELDEAPVKNAPDLLPKLRKRAKKRKQDGPQQFMDIKQRKPDQVEFAYNRDGGIVIKSMQWNGSKDGGTGK